MLTFANKHLIQPRLRAISFAVIWSLTKVFDVQHLEVLLYEVMPDGYDLIWHRTIWHHDLMIKGHGITRVITMAMIYIHTQPIFNNIHLSLPHTRYTLPFSVRGKTLQGTCSWMDLVFLSIYLIISSLLTFKCNPLYPAIFLRGGEQQQPISCCMCNKRINLLLRLRVGSNGTEGYK